VTHSVHAATAARRPASFVMGFLPESERRV
jgi:hypothetical protein